MLKNRIIPCLLLMNGGLYKTQKFRRPVYVGDPINAVKVFNEKEVDELILLDISAGKPGNKINFDLIENIASECFMTLAYGGGIRDLEQISKLTRLGIEKIVLNTALYENPELVIAAVKRHGSQAIVGSIDVKKNILGTRKVFIKNGRKAIPVSLKDYCHYTAQLGIGEIFMTSINHEGCMRGYDGALVKEVSNLVNVPVIAHGGAATTDDFRIVIKECGASAAAAGSIFVFYGPHRAVLISYPNYHELESYLSE